MQSLWCSALPTESAFQLADNQEEMNYSFQTNCINQLNNLLEQPVGDYPAKHVRMTNCDHSQTLTSFCRGSPSNQKPHTATRDLQNHRFPAQHCMDFTAAVCV